MRIVKPHGRTETAPNAEGRPKRRIHRHPGDGDVRDIEAFAVEHPELVLAQWVSAIDKIAAKPRGSAKPTREQRDLRDKLGEAAWEVLKRRRPLLDRLDELETLWRRKIHPYGDGYDNESKAGARGRWYGRFAGEDGPGAVDAAGVARKIEEHLHDKEYRIGGGRPDRREGRIAARAASIAGNVVTPVDRLPRAAWTDDDRERYRKAGDVAAEIRREAEALEAGERRVGPRVAAKALHAHYAKLFPGEDGKALSIAEAGNRAPGPFALHMAVRGAYSRILKNHGKDRKEHGDRRRPVSGLLPADMDALFRLVEAMGRNRDLNALVRLGKLIHYEAAPVPNMETAAGDEPEHAIDRWPDETKIERGRYRTSAGQSDIKRNEAFVRVWRGAVALAQRTLTDWADPDRGIDRDMVSGENEIAEATGARFESVVYRRKLSILFGNRAVLFESDDEAFERSVLRSVLTGWRELRNGSFHFTGRGGFARALKRGAEDKDADERVLKAAREFLQIDRNGRHDRLVEALRAAHVEDYLEKGRIQAILDALARGAPARSPLPRFRRVLDRAERAWRNDERYRLRLPDPENWRAMEANPGLQARYIVLKTLYERAFPAWLEARDAATLDEWIGRAEERGTGDARTINRDKHAKARAAGLIRLKDGEGIAKFMDWLAHLTATEFRVQRGYESDPGQARKQAEYLENLRRDVVAQAFAAYLEENDLDWARDDFGVALPEDRKPNLAEFDAPPETWTEEAEDWQAAFYVLLHMVPPEAAGRLRHQLRKWAVLEGKARGEAPSAEAAEIERLLDLYLDMHDAKFEDDAGLAGAEALRDLFESPKTFRAVCPDDPGDLAHGHVPWRGLREMLRFGAGEPRLKKPIFERHPVREVDVDELERLEAAPADGGASLVAGAHARREELHAAWAKKKRLSETDRAAYREALDTVVAHRHRAAHVRLVNHAKLHRLAMAVLGRLADYAGLWERDLYFATLALVRLEGKTPEGVFTEKGLDRLREGRIVDALQRNNSWRSEGSDAVRAGLKALFGDGFPAKGGDVGIRRNLMHFNMLQRGANEPFDLTAEVNDARRLMAYDRKLKNAVSRSIVELLAREGLDLAWDMRDHELTRATVASRRAVHLGGAKTGGKRIVEDLHGEPFVAMAAALFGGEARGAARKGGPPDRGRPAPGSPPPRPTVLPAAGQQVRAVLIDEKTKRGGWKAETVGTTRVVGHILNSDEVPPDAGPGLEEELVVKVSNPANASFEWPSPAVEARLAKPAARREGRPKGRRR